MNSDEIIQKIQAKLAEQNEVIRDQQIQIHEQQQRIEELETQVKEMSSVFNPLIHKLVKVSLCKCKLKRMGLSAIILLAIPLDMP